MAGKSRELPSAVGEVSQNYPAIWKSYTDLGAAWRLDRFACDYLASGP